MKDQFVLWMGIFVGVLWTVLGLLYLFRLHRSFFGVAYLVLAALFFFNAVRYKRKQRPKPPLAP
jgi:membrane protein implicated in regulation of membrane protease activity